MSPQPGTLNIVRNVISLYRTPVMEVSSKCVFTNTTFVSPYRGAGRPEGNYFMERLIDYAAAETGFDRIELRRKNQIRKSEIPWKAASGATYDSGDFPAILKKALEASDWKGFNKRKRESKKRGKMRGIGVGCYLEVTAPANKEMGGIAFDADGGVTIRTGTLDYGQGHASPFAQVLSDRLGVPFDKVRILQGDSDELLAGGGTGGSRSMMNSGQAIVEAAAKVVEQGKQIASHALEASAGDIEFKDGKFVVAGTDREIGIMELAQKVRAGMALPPDGPQSLDVKHVSEGAPAAYPNGCHVCEVEIDPDTGNIEVVKYTAVNDFGTIINPMLVDGQLHGGVTQGIGQTLMEHTVYDENGQLLSGSFMDYAMPKAHNVARLRGAEPSGAGQDQSARREGLRRGRLRGLAHLDHERGGRCAVGLRHQAHRHAGKPGARLAGDPGREGEAVIYRPSCPRLSRASTPWLQSKAWMPGTSPAMTRQSSVQRNNSMTEATDLTFAARRASDTRLVAGVSAAHFVSHFYMLVLPPLFAFVRADYGVSYTELGLALTVFNVVSAVAQTPAGFLIDRINARLALVAGLLLGAAGFAVAAAGQLVLGAGRDVRRDRARQHRLSPGRLCAAVAPRRARAHEPGLFGAHLLRHARQRRRARRGPVPARPVRLARRVSRRGGARPHRRAGAAVPARRRAAPAVKPRDTGSAPTRAGGCCSRRRS